MSDVNKAVFLSYASQDAEAARRICESLRAAGVEVWFDQSELRGGDAWDVKIRKQIRECALFVPIISANTQTRSEGYFRLEWRLADQRTHLMGRSKAFLLPVSVDDTRDTDADVPDSFLAVQWTRLPRGETPAAFGERVKKLLGGTVAGVADPGLRAGLSAEGLAKDGPASPRPATISRSRLRRWWIAGAAILIVAGVGVAVLQPWRHAVQPPLVTGAGPLSEARQLVAKARELFEAPEVTNRENILLAEKLCDKAVELDPADAEVWAARAQLSYTMVSYGHDKSWARMQVLASDAERAVALAPNSFEARLAMAFSLARQPARRAEAERIYRSLLKENPADKRVLRNLGHVLRWEGRVDEGLPLLDQAAALPGGDPIALADKANVFYFLARLPEAEEAVERSIAQAPTGRAYLIHTLLLLTLRGDTERAKESLERVSLATLQENRGVNIATLVWLWRREPERCLEFLRSVPQDFIEDIYFTGPKSVLTARAHQLAGHAEAARADREAALTMLEGRGPNQRLDLRVLRCELLAQVGRQAEASRLFSEIEQTQPADWRKSSTDAVKALIALGRYDEALVLIPALIGRSDERGGYFTRPELRLDPTFDPLRSDPRFLALLVEPAAAS